MSKKHKLAHYKRHTGEPNILIIFLGAGAICTTPWGGQTSKYLRAG